MSALAALIRRDIKIALRVGGGALIGVLFFLTVTVLMPFAIGPDLPLLTRLGPAILWLGALLASLLTLDRLFTADHEDGSLDLIVMGRSPLELACAAKALAHWLAAGLPLIVATPALGLMLNLDATATSAVALTLLVGTPALTFTGMIGAALAVTLHRGGLLLAVLVLPLSIPVLIFGVAASQAAITGPLPFGTPFSILCALSLVSLVIGPFAAAASLLTLDRLFTADHEDGSLDLIVMGRTPLELACATKALAHWLAAGLPLIVATPVLGLMLNLDATATSAVALTLLAGTPALTFTGMIGAALAVTLHRGGLLLAVLVLPLSIPVLIFGVAASQAAITGPLAFGTPFSILCALSLVSFVVGPFAAAASLRHGLD